VLCGMTCCGECEKKDKEIEYLRAVIALDSLPNRPLESEGKDLSKAVSVVEIQQQLRLVKQQLLLARADIQYMNREVQSVFSWISKIISVFLSCCGRLGETTASVIVDSATKVGTNVSRLVFSK
jgi:hypothetical protein